MPSAIHAAARTCTASYRVSIRRSSSSKRGFGSNKNAAASGWVLRYAAVHAPLFDPTSKSTRLRAGEHRGRQRPRALVRLAIAAVVVIGCAERVCPKAMPRARAVAASPRNRAGCYWRNQRQRTRKTRASGGGTKLTGLKDIKHRPSQSRPVQTLNLTNCYLAPLHKDAEAICLLRRE